RTLPFNRRAPPARLLDLDLDDIHPRGADIAHRARRAGLLPVEIAEPQDLAALGLARGDFGDLAAVDHDAQARSILGDGCSGLSRLEQQPPGARPLVVEELMIARGIARGR